MCAVFSFLLSFVSTLCGGLIMQCGNPCSLKKKNLSHIKIRARVKNLRLFIVKMREKL